MAKRHLKSTEKRRLSLKKNIADRQLANCQLTQVQREEHLFFNTLNFRRKNQMVFKLFELQNSKSVAKSL